MRRRAGQEVPFSGVGTGETVFRGPTAHELALGASRGAGGALRAAQGEGERAAPSAPGKGRPHAGAARTPPLQADVLSTGAGQGVSTRMRAGRSARRRLRRRPPRAAAGTGTRARVTRAVQVVKGDIARGWEGGAMAGPSVQRRSVSWRARAGDDRHAARPMLPRSARAIHISRSAVSFHSPPDVAGTHLWAGWGPTGAASAGRRLARRREA